MKKTLSKNEFVEEFKKVRPVQFTDEALIALYDYYMDYEDSAGEEIDFDPISICCYWGEYDSLEDAQAEYVDPIEEEYILRTETEAVLIRAY